MLSAVRMVLAELRRAPRERSSSPADGMASADGVAADGRRALHRGPPWPDATRVVSNETLAEHGVACPPGGIAACATMGGAPRLRPLCLMARAVQAVPVRRPVRRLAPILQAYRPTWLRHLLPGQSRAQVVFGIAGVLRHHEGPPPRPPPSPARPRLSAGLARSPPTSASAASTRTSTSSARARRLKHRRRRRTRLGRLKHRRRHRIGRHWVRRRRRTPRRTRRTPRRRTFGSPSVGGAQFGPSPAQFS